MMQVEAGVIEFPDMVSLSFDCLWGISWRITKEPCQGIWTESDRVSRSGRDGKSGIAETIE